MRWFLDWEERQGEVVPVSHRHLAWMFWPDEPDVVLPDRQWRGDARVSPAVERNGRRDVGARVVTLLESWERRYGADLVANHGTIIELVVRRPPRTVRESWEIAIEHESIAPDTLRMPGVTLREHARALPGHPTWFVHERP